MKFQITPTLEINLLSGAKTKPQYASEFAIKNRIQAMVVLPEFIQPLSVHRAAMGGQYQIIAAIDFPKGNNFAMDKIYRSNVGLDMVDGFEILLSANRTEVELNNEMKSIYEFLRSHRPTSNIRWCLRMGSDLESSRATLKNLAKYPPSYIRLDPNLVVPAQPAEKYQELMKMVREFSPHPIKVSGNVNLELINALADSPAKRFDVSLEQAESIVRGLNLLETDQKKGTAKHGIIEAPQIVQVSKDVKIIPPPKKKPEELKVLKKKQYKRYNV